MSIKEDQWRSEQSLVMDSHCTQYLIAIMDLGNDQMVATQDYYNYYDAKCQMNIDVESLISSMTDSMQNAN